MFAIGRLIVHIVRLVWRKEAFRGLFLITLITIFSGTWVYYRFEPTITTWVDAYCFTLLATNEQVVFRDAATGRELARTGNLPRMSQGANISPGFIDFYQPVLVSGIAPQIMK